MESRVEVPPGRVTPILALTLFINISSKPPKWYRQNFDFRQLVLACIKRKFEFSRREAHFAAFFKLTQFFQWHFQNCAMVLIRLRNAGGCAISNPASITSHIGARATFACSSMIFLTRFQLFALFSFNISICTSIFSQKILKQKVYKCRLPFSEELPKSSSKSSSEVHHFIILGW